ncbi:MAG TPA: PIN domain-containing protein [Caulobacteraceae bacterium]
MFVDTGAWIALALLQDPLHAAAREQWEMLQRAGARLHTSIPVVIETFTFLDRNARRDVALSWKASALDPPSAVTMLTCEKNDLEEAWTYFRRTDLHKLSLADATSFAIMKRMRISVAFAFDHHFAMAGFRLVA